MKVRHITRKFWFTFFANWSWFYRLADLIFALIITTFKPFSSKSNERFSATLTSGKMTIKVSFCQPRSIAESTMPWTSFVVTLQNYYKISNNILQISVHNIMLSTKIHLRKFSKIIRFLDQNRFSLLKLKNSLKARFTYIEIGLL